MTACPTSSDAKLPPIVSRSYYALIQERDALEKALQEYANAPKPGCTYLSEKEAWKGAPHRQRAHRRRLWGDATNQSLLMIGNILDHMWAASRLLNGESVPIYAHMTLSRVLVEAAARICYLTDPAVGYEGRVVRGATLGLQSINAHVTAAQSLPSTSPAMPHALTDAIKKRDKLEDRIKRAGLEFKLNANQKRTHLQDSGSGVSEALKINLTALVEKYFADRPSWYRLSSGVIHSARWMLDDVVVGSDHQGVTMVPDFMGIGAATMLAIDACQAVAKTYAQFYGHNPQLATRASALRTQVVDLLIRDLAATKGII